MSNDYVTVKIPKELAEAIDKIVGSYGFRSRSEVIKEALRDLLRRYGVYPSLEDKPRR